jgi:hypothetical protein
MGGGDSGSEILVRLPQTEGSPRGILHNGHATGIENIKGRRQNCAAEFGGASGSGVGAFDGDIQIPVRRNAAGELVGTKCTAGCGITPFELKNGIEVVGTDGKTLDGPAKDFGIEIRGGGLVGGGEFHPAERAGSVFFDVGHDGESVLREERGGKPFQAQDKQGGNQIGAEERDEGGAGGRSKPTASKSKAAAAGV